MFLAVIQWLWMLIPVHDFTDTHFLAYDWIYVLEFHVY